MIHVTDEVGEHTEEVYKVDKEIEPKKKLRKIIFIIAICIIMLTALRLGLQLFRRIVSEKRNEVSKIVYYQLNGEKQSVLLEGKSCDLPILIMVHGGPCFPVPFNEGCRGLFPEITDTYLTVYWDQLGCGKNRKTYTGGKHLPEDITIDDYVLMLKDLVLNVKNDYPNQKVYLFGISWGTILTTKVAANYSELVDGVLVYGQFLGNMFQTDDVIDEIIKVCGNNNVEQLLNDYKEKEKLNNKEIYQIESYINKYTDGFIYHGKTGKKQSYGKMIKIILNYFVSPDYGLREAIGALTDHKSAKNLASVMIHSDISKDLANIKVPYKILQGEKDLQTSRYQIENFVDNVKNPNITIDIVPDCGHIPTTRCFKRLIDEILRIRNE